VGSSDSGGFRSVDADGHGVRRRRWNVPKSRATSCTDSGAYTEPDADSDSDANSHADADSDANSNAHTNAHAWWWHDGDHHVRRRVTEDADRCHPDARDIRQQRLARA
jgi:hypothetical protein